MIKTAFFTVPSVITEDEIKKEAASLPHFIRERNTAYIDDILQKKHRSSAYRSLVGLRLLSELISEMNITPALRRTKFGRPYFADTPDIDFSISHSDSLVVCALCVSKESTPRVGIDCEDIYGKDPLPLASRFFTEDEFLKILEASDKALAFTELWTKKEAYLKYLGSGLSTPLNTFDVSNLPLCFKTERRDSCIITLCAQASLY